MDVFAVKPAIAEYTHSHLSVASIATRLSARVFLSLHPWRLPEGQQI
jgi:hypothetical protein